MSSIFGKCHAGEKQVGSEDLGMMRGELNYWNADDANILVKGRAGFGHLALYNTPESLNEKQPLYNGLYGLCITADARIDNREELYSLLRINTPEERLYPDGTLILQLYKKYNADCIKYIIGDFAFAIWDEQEQLVFCARDHMGVKPFFYYYDGQFLAFASEQKGILCLQGIDKTIDKPFFYNEVFEPAIQAADTTLHKYIRRLQPAHTLTFDTTKNKLDLKKYWALDADKEIKFARKEEYYEGLLHHFEEAVRCRLRSHYQVGAELSGGLDSSAITGAANHFLNSEHRHLITFSNASADGAPADPSGVGDEREYIDAVNEFNRIEEFVIVTEDIWDSIADEVDFSLGTNSGLDMWSPTWLMPIKKAAMQRNVRTILSGFPGDEMVSYRGQFYFLDYLDKGQYLKYFLAKTERRFKKIKPFLGPDLEFRLHKLRNKLTLNNKKIKDLAEFFGVPAKYRYAKGDVVWEDSNYRERFKSYRHFQKYRLLKPEIARRMEMETRFGLIYKTEPRYPMADIRLTQYYLSMPNELKYEGDLSRNAYRIALIKYLPELVVRRDDKRANMMPFKTTVQADSKRQAFLLQTLNNFEDTYRHDNRAMIKKVLDREYNALKFPEVLKWFEKNVVNLVV